MKIVIGSEKAGFQLKSALLAHVQKNGHQVTDVGPQNCDELISFGGIADQAARLIMQGKAERGILICGTGTGMALAANKHKGVYAAVVESEYAVRYARLINNANVLCLGVFIVAPRMAQEIVDTFLATGFLTNFETWRVNFLTSEHQVLREIEAREFK